MKTTGALSTFSMESTAWNNLLSNLDKLNTREVLTVQDSLLAAYRAGSVDSAVYLKGMKVFAQNPEYEVAAKAGDLLGFLEDLDTDDDLARLVQDMYGARYMANVGKDTVVHRHFVDANRTDAAGTDD